MALTRVHAQELSYYGPYDSNSSAAQKRHEQVGSQCARRGNDGTSGTMGQHSDGTRLATAFKFTPADVILGSALGALLDIQLSV